MLEDEAKEKITAYFERLGIDLKTINFARVVLQVKDGEVVGHEFLHDDEPDPMRDDPTQTITPSPKKERSLTKVAVTVKSSHSQRFTILRI